MPSPNREIKKKGAGKSARTPEETRTVTTL